MPPKRKTTMRRDPVIVAVPLSAPVGSDRWALLQVAKAMAGTLALMDASGVAGLEVQRDDPPTPFEHQVRALDGVLALLGIKDVAEVQRVRFELMTGGAVLLGTEGT